MFEIEQGGITNAFYRKSYCHGGPCEFSNAGDTAM